MSSSDLEVWLDCDLDEMRRVGTLSHDRGLVRFSDDKAWPKDAKSFMLDPDLSLDGHPFSPKPEAGNFGTVLDSSPDRWGQALVKRREALRAKDADEKPRTLHLARVFEARPPFDRLRLNQ